ncbi:Nramp family divalent metal transporter [Catalinimonas niigatensis]|uniref:Nramp family divalent metal transporter n=1 Tax=Catalinimonas niigatensis TaxID=1397264 RepID=UPI002666DE94|nr:Nramp family divalent metal transporter [Catalinimonas niigatensis]WPP49591.1 Nramp family divalent metal transporter [Catalinimonas niigatensis]
MLTQENTNLQDNPYVLDQNAIKDPPTRWKEKLQQLGPGFILSAAIVGSGELIATTTLGAEAGFATFWVVILSCLVKVTLQLEFGKHAIYCGETVMSAFNRLPGPRLRGTNWSIWTWLFIQIFKLLQVGGIVGGVAITLNIAFPQINDTIWAFLAAILSSLLIFKGYYRFIEKFSIGMIGLFTLLTFASLFFLQYTTFALSWDNLIEGVSFNLPPAAVGVAIAAFGITGVGGDEIMYYNYWCLEKGYARFVGPEDGSEAWLRRAKGWIKVMYLDALLSMVVYTLVTAAFYLLGAAVLHRSGLVPEGYEMIDSLSRIYTETLGPWAKSIYLFGALIVLFSTLFAALASWTRIFSDAFGQIGWINFYNPQVRKRSIAILAWVFPLCWAVLFIFIKLPVMMILVGGFVTSILLLVVVYAAFQFRYRRLPEKLTPTPFYDFALVLSAVVIVAVGVYSIVKVF